MDLLLLSNSTAPGRSYLEHARDALAEILESIKELVFVPYALADHEGYTAQVGGAFEQFGVRVTGVHTGTPANLIRQAEAIFIGGGNTFRLVRRLQTEGLITGVRSAVENGTRYIGSSAGTNVATPSLKTTNDMPIVEPHSFTALGLVPFQINPHYLDPDPASTHQGETRELRILQYLEENPGPVVGLREGTWLRRRGHILTLAGESVGARLFDRGAEPVDIATGADLSYLLASSPR